MPVSFALEPSTSRAAYGPSPGPTAGSQRRPTFETRHSSSSVNSSGYIPASSEYEGVDQEWEGGVRFPEDVGERDRDGEAGEEAEEHVKKRYRKPSSCVECRTKKRRCNRAAPCDQCSSRGLLCSWADAVPLFNARSADEIKALHARVTHLEGLLHDMTLSRDAERAQYLSHLSATSPYPLANSPLQELAPYARPQRPLRLPHLPRRRSELSFPTPEPGWSSDPLPSPGFHPYPRPLSPRSLHSPRPLHSPTLHSPTLHSPTLHSPTLHSPTLHSPHSLSPALVSPHTLHSPHALESYSPPLDPPYPSNKPDLPPIEHYPPPIKQPYLPPIEQYPSTAEQYHPSRHEETHGEQYFGTYPTLKEEQ